MPEFTCKQKGCSFEAEEFPELCPICRNPMISNLQDAEPDPEQDIEHDAFDVGYQKGKIYVEDGTMFDPPEDYSDEENDQWISGYETAIDESIVDNTTPT